MKKVDDGNVSWVDFAISDSATVDDLSSSQPDLVTTDMSSLASHCPSDGSSVFYLDGDPSDWIHPGTEQTQVSSWYANFKESDTFWYQSPVTSDLKGGWAFGFSSLAMGQPLAIGRYDNAMYHGSESPGRPGLTISGEGRDCDSVSGWFEIESISGGPVNGTFTELTATFEQHCDEQPAALRGCIHFEN